jgi:hypothetical protein
MINLGFDNNVIHVVFQDACHPDDLEDLYEYFGIQAFDFNDETEIIYDFTFSYFKDNGFLNSFKEILEIYQFSKEYFTGLKSLSDIMFKKFTEDLDTKNILLKENYSELCLNLSTKETGITK